ncbi:hypothetical protein ACFQQB_31455 [Nonomuraea rubra]|uniref:hypothetical protein n=1 Tax=Nonomuraea rubra TaxID=46180 RepID=UPI00361F2182
MRVDEPGQHEPPGRVDHLGARLGGQAGTDRGDRAAVHAYVHPAQHHGLGLGVDDDPVLDQDGGCHA